MKTFTCFSSLLAVATITLAAPAGPDPNEPDCTQYDPITSGNYIVNPDQWGQVEPTTCVQVQSSSDNSLSWSAQWSWPNGGTNVKSYPNAQLSNWECKPLSSYNSIQSSWTWDYNPDPTSADVSYDAFVSNDSSSCGTPAHTAEVMIWLAKYNLTPISDSGPTPHTPNAIPGWDLYVGTNSGTKVPAYSFVSQNSPLKSYNGDLMVFFSYLKSVGLVDETEYLQEVHAGTEPASGDSMTFTTSVFTLESS